MTAKAGLPADQHREWMEENWDKYQRSILTFEESLLSGRVDFASLIEAYQEITLVWVNARDADEFEAEKRSRKICQAIKKLMLKYMQAGRPSCSMCSAWWDRYKGYCAESTIAKNEMRL